MVKLIIAGTAISGPVNEVLEYKSYEEAIASLGGSYSQRQTITPTATSILLDYEPIGAITSWVSGYGQNYLYSLSTDSSSAVFGSIGGDTNIVCDVFYQPYTGKSDLIACLQVFRDLNLPVPAVMRIGGTTANANSNGWVLRAVEDGAMYNSIVFTSTTGSVSVSGLEPKYQALNYTNTSPAIIAKQINEDALSGFSPIFVEEYPTSLSSESIQLSGGVVASMTDQQIEDALNYTSIPSKTFGMVLLTEATSSIFNSIETFNTSQGNKPIVFLMAAPSYSASSVIDYSTTVNTNLPLRTYMAGMVVGDINTIVNNELKTRYAVEGLAASFASRNIPLSFTNQRIECRSFTPTFTEYDLDVLKRIGVMAPVETILKGPAIYRSVASATGSLLEVGLHRSIVWSIAYKEAFKYIGKQLIPGRFVDLENEIINQLQLATPDINLNYIECTVIDDVTVEGLKDYTKTFSGPSNSKYITHGQAIFVKIEIIVFDTIYNITFTSTTQK